MSTLAQRLATYAADFRYEALPQAVRHEAKRRIIDALGCALGAYTAEPAKIARTVALEQGGRQSTLFGTPRKTTADLAAFANGLMIRYLDYNDTYLSKEPAHPSDNIAAALAVAETAGRGGKDVVAATVLGYEIQCRLADAASIRARGWDHVTYGAISTTLLAGWLMGLGPAELEEAVNLAATPNVALRQTRAGGLSMWKGAAFANAARNGVFAAMLARHGMTGPSPVFEGTMGFFAQVSGTFDLGDLGGEGRGGYRILDTYIKHYPAEYHSQVAIELMLEMRRAGLRPEDVGSLTIHTFKAGVEIIADPDKWRPRTRETADHSLPYCAAVALFDGDVSPDQFRPERIADPALQSFLDRVRVVEDPALTAQYPDGIPTRVEVLLTDGTSRNVRRDYALGHPHNAMPDYVLEAKFRRQATPLLSTKQQDRLLQGLWRFEEVEDLAELLREAII